MEERIVGLEGRDGHEREIGRFVAAVAGSYAATVKGKRSRIIGRTLPGSRQAGKIYAIDRLGLYLREMRLDDLEPEGEIAAALDAKVRRVLDALLQESRLYNEEFRGGMEDALRMVGGYYFKSVARVQEGAGPASG